MSMTSCGLSETLVKINLEVSSTYLKVSLVARPLILACVNPQF